MLSFSVTVPAVAKTSPALAVLSRLKGEVNAGPAKKMSEGFNGKMLRNRYRVRTEKKSGATIFFNDGSEVRLFGSTEITIGARKSHNSRWVRYRLVLRSGSFWGNFVRGKNPVEIGGGGLRLQLSDSSIRFTKKKTGSNISVSSGIVKVFNKVSSVKIHAGQRLYHVQKTDFLPQKVTLVPNQLKLRIEPSAPSFSANKTLKLNLHFQVVRLGSDHAVKRSGPVLLTSDYYNLTLPDSIQLNANGQAKTSIEVKAPRSDDRTF
ncbi:MAG: hypothetical protein HN351_05775, partial [Deltaproteobacteria bacterium]|nr:hypothetical protein [Deltaproteobacteria bacterium]